MKRWLSMLIAVVVLVSSLGIHTYAANGPMGPWEYAGETISLAYIVFVETDETGAIKRDQDNNVIGKAIYTQETVSNELSGASYDKTTNTLTITNLSADNMIMETNVMGDDFTMNVVGNCSIGQIKVWGDGYGGTLNITGNGTLTVNSKKLYDNAIVLNAEGSNASLNFGKDVNVNLYAKQNTAEVIMTAVDAANKAVTFANGQSVSIAKNNYQDRSSKYIMGFDLSYDADELTKVTKNGDASIYGAEQATHYPNGYGEDSGIEGYIIYKLFYDETQKAYFVYDNDDVFVSESDFTEDGYTLSEDTLEKCYTQLTTLEVYKDASGKEYAVKTEYNNGVEGKKVMTFEPLAGTDLYLFTEASGVAVEGLEVVIENTLVEGLYNYTLSGTEFLYKAGTTSSGEDTGATTPSGGDTGTTTPSGGDTGTKPSGGDTGITPPSGGGTGTTSLLAGTQITDSKSKGTYEVIKAEGTTGTVTYTGTEDKKAKTVAIPATVTVDGITYNVTAVADNAFKGNKTVTKVSIPKNVTTIGKNAFSGCTKLKTVTVGSDVTTVGANAFKDCKALTKITLPGNTTKIGANAFSGCKKLNTITIKSKKMTSKNIDKNAFKGVSTKATIKVPSGKAKTYKTLFQKKGLSKKVKVK
ncbi:MAG: leucine-rich repeat domain-containing protein [Clostridiales bacterium]|nr:leucine-rich repeat domain-containing protein [Clostridiales bacterium]